MSNAVIDAYRHVTAQTFQAAYTTADADGYTIESETRLSYDGVAVQVGILSPGECNAYFLFTGVNVPPGATINTATFNNRIRGSYGGTDREVTWKWVGAKESNPSRPADYDDYWDRPLTTVSVNESKQSPYADDTYEDTTNLAAIIQEIIDQPDWESGNSILLFAHYQSGNYGRAWDAASVSLPRTLIIEYLT